MPSCTFPPWFPWIAVRELSLPPPLLLLLSPSLVPDRTLAPPQPPSLRLPSTAHEGMHVHQHQHQHQEQQRQQQEEQHARKSKGAGERESRPLIGCHQQLPYSLFVARERERSD